MSYSPTVALRRWKVLVAMIALVQARATHGLLPAVGMTGVRVRATSTSSSSSVVLMAKSVLRNKFGGPKTAAAGGKVKKKKHPNSKALAKKNNNNDNNKSKDTPRKKEPNNGVALPSHKSNAPPWVVLSAKETKQNVAREKKRRDLARQGLDIDDDEEEFYQGARKKSLSESLLSVADRQIVNWKRFNPSSVPCGVNFVGAFLGKQLPPRLGVPEVAFLGRSNVGKSSLLNKLSAAALGSSGTSAAAEARVGKTPGATASVNLYAMLGKAKQQKEGSEKVILGMADLPGFGYAKLSKETQAAVQEAAERYLGKRQELALGILLVDARRVPSDDDRAVLAALYDLGLPIIVVTTKIDKLNKSQVEPAMRVIRDALGLPDGQPLCVSSVTGEGTKQLWKIIMEACEDKVEELKEKLILQRSTDEASEEHDGAMYTTEYDDDGNPILPFDDGEALAYDQGYDWIQDSTVMYDYDGQRALSDDDTSTVQNSDDEEVEYDDGSNEPAKEDSFKLKDLKKRLRKMEREGEVF